MPLSRRDFLAHSAGATSLVASGLTLPGFLTRTARASVPLIGNGDRVLVIIQMTGGNDGLNTVVPYTDDLYHRARPTLRVRPDSVLTLADDLGLHPEMTAMKALFDEGRLGVFTNVGYPNPDRSHFRSMDIWHAASMTPETAEDGWLGRVVDSHAAEDSSYALHLDNSVLPLALKTKQRSVPSIASIDSFRLNAVTDGFEQSIASTRQDASDDLLFVQRVAVSSCANARRLRTIDQAASDAGAYPAYGLAGRLRQIAQLICAGFGPRIYYTSISGFDTHARQVLTHPALMRELSESISAFHRDLESRGQADRVLTMTFSEFGRRVGENGSRGTDHGAAAPMFFVGNPARAGIQGGHPDLSDEATGDVPFETDFRSIYAGVLDEWLGIDPMSVLGGRFSGSSVVQNG